jgi:hypothetical protein
VAAFEGSRTVFLNTVSFPEKNGPVSKKLLRAGDPLGRLLQSGGDEIVIERIVVTAAMIGFVLFVNW